ncbi:endonuclease exonuclease phosphatase family [Fusarium sporotrichioides]|uniref:Endonuclease exonuclease phosphatase family n=1 Tax=Fusarium sporotrichioides TaxID=5514 RepID=A0A395RWM0_FUSSP|nr:endonuclease exonuclease phosphatase family [Fusarium sporotrichioides]
MNRPYHSYTDSAHVNRVIALELARRGDARDVDDISDMEFNELYLDAFPEAMLDQETGPVFLKPELYDPQSSSWAPSTVRASAVIAHLQAMFGQQPHNLVVMLQNVSQESLDVILKDKWTQHNFAFSDTEPPYEFDKFDDDDEEADLGLSRDFNMMMISRNLPIANCFRVPFVSETNRDALVVDVPVSVSEDHGPDVSKQSLRLCTTRFESSHAEMDLGYDQLASVSELLKGELSQGQKILGGLVGGDISGKDVHRDPRIGLKDVWEDEPSSVLPIPKSSWTDTTSGIKIV